MSEVNFNTYTSHNAKHRTDVYILKITLPIFVISKMYTLYIENHRTCVYYSYHPTRMFDRLCTKYA